MKNFKKVVAAGLALLMLALSVNVSFAAENYTEKEAIVVAKVNGAAIMTGTDKGFEPSKTLTRAEAAAIMVRMKGISEDTVKQNAGTTLFTDVAASHWAAGYVNVASNYGIIKGVGANKFAPEKEVTVAEFYTMAIRSLNAGAVAEAEGTWPTNYVNFAIENKLAEDVAQIYTAAATRMTAATIVANTLEANMWKKGAVKNGEITWEEDTTKNILKDTLNIVEIPNVLITDIKAKDSKASFKADEVVVCNKVSYDWKTAKVEKEVAERANIAAAKAGVKYTVMYDFSEKEVVGYYIPKETTSIYFEEIKSFNTNGEIKLKVDGEEVKYKGDGATLYINGDVDGTTTLPGYALPLSGVAHYGNGTDGATDKLVRIYAEAYDHWGVVKEVTDKKIKFEDSSKVAGTTWTETITIDLDKDSSYNYAVTKDGKEISIKDIEEGDVVFGYHRDENNKDYVLEVFEDSIEGKVSTKSDKKVTIDGKKYDLMNNGLANAGDEGTFYFAKNGKIVMFNAEKKTSEVAMISAVKPVASEIYNGTPTIMVKYTDMNGTTSDWTEVDDDKSDSTLYAAISGADKYDLVGTLVAFEIKSGKFVLKVNPRESVKIGSTDKYTSKVNKDTLFWNISAFTDAKTDSLTISEDFANAGNDDIDAKTKAWYLASDVKVFEKESNNKDDYKKEVTLKEVNVDDLDDLSGLAASYMADIDFTQRTAGILVLEKTNIVADKRWAIVLDIAEYSDDNDDTKEDKSVSVLFAGDKEETVFLAEASNLKYKAKGWTSGSPLTALAEGDIVEISTDGEIIKRISDGGKVLDSKAAEVTTNVAGNYFVKGYNNNTYTLGSYTTNVFGTRAANAAEDKETRILLADDVVVAQFDSAKTEYKVATFDDIKFLDVDGVDKTTSTSDDDATRINDNNLNGANSLVKFVTYTDDGETEVVAIIFNK